MTARTPLTTTSYAILGLLSIRPWTTYALAQQMKRSLHHLWPRAESNVYAEPKRLVAWGLVTAEAEATGRRERTRYTITDKGRRALETWLAQPSAAPRFESEAMVKVLFADHGTKDDLLRTLRELETEALEAIAAWALVASEYADHAEPFPDRAHVNALIASFFWEQQRARATWAAWAIAHVEGWPDIHTPDDPAAARRLFAEIARGG